MTLAGCSERAWSLSTTMDKTSSTPNPYEELWRRPVRLRLLRERPAAKLPPQSSGCGSGPRDYSDRITTRTALRLGPRHDSDPATTQIAPRLGPRDYSDLATTRIAQRLGPRDHSDRATTRIASRLGPRNNSDRATTTCGARTQHGELLGGDSDALLAAARGPGLGSCDAMSPIRRRIPDLD